MNNSNIDSLRRKLVLGAGAGVLAAPFAGFAQGISGKPVRIILGQTAATTPDLIARLLAEAAAGSLTDTRATPLSSVLVSVRMPAFVFGDGGDGEAANTREMLLFDLVAATALCLCLYGQPAAAGR